MDLTTGDGEGLLQRVGESFGHDLGRIGGEALHDQDDELVAAEAGEHVIGVEEMADPFGEGTQQLIADVVPVAVVHQLEAVDVDQQQCNGAVAAPQRLRDPLSEMGTVECARQVVVARLVGESFVLAPLLDEIGHELGRAGDRHDVRVRPEGAVRREPPALRRLCDRLRG